jgi:hypothetical protein
MIVFIGPHPDINHRKRFFEPLKDNNEPPLSISAKDEISISDLSHAIVHKEDANIV